jgi:hypothetical protein
MNLSRKHDKWIIGSFIAACAVVVLVVMVAANKQGQRVPAAEVVSTSNEWHEVAVWKGSGAKTTEPFRIEQSPWIIEWTLGRGSYDAQLLQVFVYRGDDQHLDGVAVNTLAPGADSTYMYGTGTYHLQMNAMGSWTVRVLSTGSSAAAAVALRPTPTTRIIPARALNPAATAVPTATPALTATPRGLQLTSFGDGTYTVGIDIKPGNYKTEIALEMGCHWSLLNQNGTLWSDGQGPLGPGVVPISPTDRTFTTKGCGTWRPLESTG